MNDVIRITVKRFYSLNNFVLILTGVFISVVLLFEIKKPNRFP